MDRVIVYPGAEPLETDILNTNRNAMIALGRLAMDLLGTTTLVSGLACTQTTVPSMNVAIGAGAIYALQTVDATTYSTLPANTTDSVMKQGVLLASANTTLATAAPTTPGYSIIYLIEAAFQEVDTNPTVLPYYNSTNTSLAYLGPGNSGVAQNTMRKSTVNVQAKAGVASASPVAPSTDSGFVPLYYVTVPYGATSVTNAMISVAPGAPFMPGSLSSFAPLASPTFTGTPTAPTPAVTDSSSKLATTAFTHSLGFFYGGAVGFNNTATLTAANLGQSIQFYGSTNFTVTLPVGSSCPAGTTLSFYSFSSAVVTLSRQGTDFIYDVNLGSANTLAINPGDTLVLMSRGNGEWDIVGGSIALYYASNPAFFASPTGPTPAQFDNSTKFATTAFVQRQVGNFAGYSALSGTQTLGASVAGYYVVNTTAGTASWTLPNATINAGYCLAIENAGTGNLTLTSGGGNFTGPLGSGSTTLVLAAGTTVEIVADGSAWHCYAGTAGLLTSANFASSIAANGYQKLSSGLIIQWGQTSSFSSESGLTVNFPIAFPTACRSATATVINTTGANTSMDQGAQVYSLSTTSMGVYMQIYGGGSSTFSCSAYWMAIGN